MHRATGRGGVAGRDAVGLRRAVPPAQSGAGAGEVDVGDLLRDPEANHLAGDGVGAAEAARVQMGPIDLSQEEQPCFGLDRLIAVAVMTEPPFGKHRGLGRRPGADREPEIIVGGQIPLLTHGSKP